MHGPTGAAKLRTAARRCLPTILSWYGKTTPIGWSVSCTVPHRTGVRWTWHNWKSVFWAATTPRALSSSLLAKRTARRARVEKLPHHRALYPPPRRKTASHGPIGAKIRSPHAVLNLRRKTAYEDLHGFRHTQASGDACNPQPFKTDSWNNVCGNHRLGLARGILVLGSMGNPITSYSYRIGLILVGLFFFSVSAALFTGTNAHVVKAWNNTLCRWVLLVSYAWAITNIVATAHFLTVLIYLVAVVLAPLGHQRHTNISTAKIVVPSPSTFTATANRMRRNHERRRL